MKKTNDEILALAIKNSDQKVIIKMCNKLIKNGKDEFLERYTESLIFGVAPNYYYEEKFDRISFYKYLINLGVNIGTNEYSEFSVGYDILELLVSSYNNTKNSKEDRSNFTLISWLCDLPVFKGNLSKYLMIAVKENRKGLVKLLISKGAEPTKEIVNKAIEMCDDTVIKLVKKLPDTPEFKIKFIREPNPDDPPSEKQIDYLNVLLKRNGIKLIKNKFDKKQISHIINILVENPEKIFVKYV